MVKRMICALLVALLLPAMALAAGAAVVDDAGLFSAEEISQMEEAIDRIRERYQMDVVVVTSYAPRTNLDERGSNSQAFADDYYDENGYGMGEDKAGLLYLIDMHNRVPVISTTGTMADYITDHRLEELFDCSYDDLARGAYGRSTLTLLNRLETFLRQGREEGSFRYDVETGERLSGVYNTLTRGELLVAVLAGAATAAAVALGVAARYSLKGSTYHYNAANNCQVQLTGKEDTFLRQTVARVPHSSGENGGGHGGGGGGMGSGMHTSSSGTSHGGGVGRGF